jgi:hypothetical protein
MSPRHFSKLFASGCRQSEREAELEQKIEHAISFAFSPVTHPRKTWSKLKRVFTNHNRQSES